MEYENLENIDAENTPCSTVIQEQTANDQTIPEQNESAQQQGFMGFLKKVLALPKKLLISAVAVLLVLVIGIPLLVGAVSNTYHTPLDLMVDFMNERDHSDIAADSIKMLNGFSKNEFKSLIKILKKSDDFEDSLDDMQENYEEMVEYYEEHYGSDYSFSYKVEEKEKLDKDDLKEMRSEIKDAAKELREIIEETEDYDSDDWDDMADDLGITRSNAKKLVKALDALYEEWKNVEVTKGYELSVVMITNGSALDEPIENETTVYVYKVNGRWVSTQSLSLVFNILPSF